MASSEAYLKSAKVMQPSGSSVIQAINKSWANLIKRSFDIVMSLIGLLFLGPVFLYIAALIKRDTPGPVFYWGPRMGARGKPFRILKFRTMYENQHSYAGPQITARGDDRITPLGKWLRETKINELPQLWNVLIGEMSLVGPRPEDVRIAQNWPMDAAQEILSVRPGITSPASILYHDEEKMLSSSNPMGDYFKNILPDKMRLDRLYVRYHTIFSDLDIIFWTLAILIPQIGKTRIPEGYIFAGPFHILIGHDLKWFILDLVTALVAVMVAGAAWRVGAPLNWGAANLAVFGIMLAFLFSSVNWIFRLNRVVWPKARAEDSFGVVVSCGLATALTLVLNYVQQRTHMLTYPALSSTLILMVGLLACAGFLATRYRLRLVSAIANRWLSLRKANVNIGERMIIAGVGEGSRIASWLIQRHMFRTAFSVVGVVDNVDPTAYRMKVGGLWMLGSINDLPALLKKHDVGVILSTLPPNSPEIEHLFQLKSAFPIRVIFLNDLLWITDQQMTRPVGKRDFPLWLDERLEFKSLHDTLTELPNSALFQDRLRHSLAFAKRNATLRAVMFVELAGLQLQDDDPSRNSLLREAADRLNHAKREIDTLTRYGNDSFALLFENIPDRTRLDGIVKRVVSAMSTPFEVHGLKTKIEPKIYVNICSGNCETSDNPKSPNIKQCYQCVRSTSMVSSEVTISARTGKENRYL